MATFSAVVAGLGDVGAFKGKPQGSEMFSSSFFCNFPRCLFLFDAGVGKKGGL